MFDIMRSQVRQMMTKKLSHVINIVVGGVLFLILFFSGNNFDGTFSSASSFVPETLTIFLSASLVGCAALVVLVSAGDFTDKTINNEIASGRSRAASYFGRVLPTLIAGPLISMLIVGVPYGLYAALHGWGDTLAVGDVLPRILLAYFPVMRLCAFLLVVVFVFKNAMMSVIASAFIPMLPIAIQANGLTICRSLMQKPYLLSVSDIASLGSFDGWYVYDLSMNMFNTYSPSLPISHIALTIGISLAMTAVYIIIGYHFFHTDDMN